MTNTKSFCNLNRMFISISIFSAILSGSLFIWYYTANNRIKQLERIVLVQSAIRNNLNDTLKTQSELKIEVDSLLRKVELQETKIEYFLQQIDIQSNWFIFFVSGVFVVFGVVSYAGFKYEIDNIIRDRHKEKIDNQHNFDKFEKEFNRLNKKQLELSRNLLGSLALQAAKQGERSQVIKFGLYSIDYNILVSNASDSEQEKDSLIKQSIDLMKVVIDNLKYIHQNINNLNDFNFNAEYDIYMITINRIILNDNPEIKELCSDVIYWLKRTLNKWGE